MADNAKYLTESEIAALPHIARIRRPGESVPRSVLLVSEPGAITPEILAWAKSVVRA